jgi:hypothetical protein
MLSQAHIDTYQSNPRLPSDRGLCREAFGSNSIQYQRYKDATRLDNGTVHGRPHIYGESAYLQLDQSIRLLRRSIPRRIWPRVRGAGCGSGDAAGRRAIGGPPDGDGKAGILKDIGRPWH